MISKNTCSRIKNKIKGRSWKDRAHVKYIKDLMFMEEGIKGGNLGWTGHMMFECLKSRYKKDYMAIMEDLYPGRYQKQEERDLAERRKKAEQREKEKRKEIEEMEKEKKLWLKLCGAQ